MLLIRLKKNDFVICMLVTGCVSQQLAMAAAAATNGKFILKL